MRMLSCLVITLLCHKVPKWPRDMYLADSQLSQQMQSRQVTHPFLHLHHLRYGLLIPHQSYVDPIYHRRLQDE